jgi:hypothetical protein
MHHAARDHDRAAFNVARQIADGLRLPLLVYQGLAGPHSDNNTRQHQFIADGTLAVQSALALDAFGLTFEAKRMRSSFSASIGEGA